MRKGMAAAKLNYMFKTEPYCVVLFMYIYITLHCCILKLPAHFPVKNIWHVTVIQHYDIGYFTGCLCHFLFCQHTYLLVISTLANC